MNFLNISSALLFGRTPLWGWGELILVMCSIYKHSHIVGINALTLLCVLCIICSLSATPFSPLILKVTFRLRIWSPNLVALQIY